SELVAAPASGGCRHPADACGAGHPLVGQRRGRLAGKGGAAAVSAVSVPGPAGRAGHPFGHHRESQAQTETQTKTAAGSSGSPGRPTGAAVPGTREIPNAAGGNTTAAKGGRPDAAGPTGP